MATIKIKRGTEAQVDAATLADYEIAFTTDTKKIVIYDGTNKKEFHPSDNVAITGGSISGITNLSVADGGTGSSTGSITGTGALTFTAGGSDQNVTLTPSGTGVIVASAKIKGSGIYPASDSTTAIQILKADGISAVLVTDTTNGRIGINKTPTTALDVDGTVTATAFSGALTGNVTGNVSGSSGSCSGNAATASAIAASGVTAATFPASTSWAFAGNSTVTVTHASAEQLSLVNNGAVKTTLTTDSSGYLTISPSGSRVGIGRAPGTSFDSISPIRVSDASYARFEVHDTSNLLWSVGTRADTSYHIYRESGAGHFIVDTTYMGINCTPAKRLEVRDGGSVAQLRLSFDGSYQTDFMTVSNGGLQVTPSGQWMQLDGNLYPDAAGTRECGSDTRPYAHIHSNILYSNYGTAGTAYTSFTTDSSGYLTITPSGSKVGIGCTPYTNLDVRDTNKAYTAWGALAVGSTDSMAVNKGGMLSLCGVYTGTAQACYANIAGRKENATDNNYAGYLQFCTSDYGVRGWGLLESMRITSAGLVGIGCTPTQTLDVAGGTTILRQVLYCRHLNGKGWGDASTSGDLFLNYGQNNHIFLNHTSTGNTFVKTCLSVGSAESVAGDLTVGTASTNATTLNINNTSAGRNIQLGVTGSGHGWGSGIFYIYDATSGVARLQTYSGGFTVIPYVASNYAPLWVQGPGTAAWGIGLVVRTTGGDDGASICWRNRDTKNWQIRGETSGTGFQICEDGGDAGSGSGFGTARMHFSAGGNVGIGTTSPAGKLHLYSDTSSTIGKLILATSTTDSANSGYQINWRDVNGNDIARIVAAQQAVNDSYMAFHTWPSSLLEAARFDKNGFFGVKTTTPRRRIDSLDADNPQLRLTQADNSKYVDFRSTSDGNLVITTGGGTWIQVFGSVYPAADNAYQMGSGSYRWADVYCADGAFNGSDLRLKTNVSPTLGLDFVMKLNPIQYKWADIETKTYKRQHHGFVAQEVKTVLEGLGLTTNDFAGYAYDEESDNYFLRYTEFIAPLVRAIQELKAEVDSLKQQIAA